MDIMPHLEDLASGLPEKRKEDLKKRVSAYLNELLLHDFAALVQLLYQVDVPEKKLKAVLKENPQKDAGDLIADLLIERQREKMAQKKAPPFSTGTTDEERW